MSLALIVRQSFIVSQSKTFAFLVQVSLKRKKFFPFKTIVFKSQEMNLNMNAEWFILSVRKQKF